MFTDLERTVVGDVWTSGALWDSVVYLCDACSGRAACSEDERRAGEYLLARFAEYGLQNVAAEPFEMTGWTRGGAVLSALVQGAPRDLPCLALPGSPAGELEAELVDVGMGTAAEFEQVGDAVRGKIVLADAAGPHRLEKYARACHAGALGFVVANTQPGMLMLTGSLSLGNGPAPIVGVGLAQETAQFLRRQTRQGALRARLSVGGASWPGVARNIVAELPGTDPAAGWLVICGHYDGHDVAQAAQDNATGTALALEAARVLAPLRAHLAAGLRFVLFSGEEYGLLGSQAYVRAHRGELEQIRCVVNADVAGLASPLRLAVQQNSELAERLRHPALRHLDMVVEESSISAHSDHFPFVAAGVNAVVAHTSAPRASLGGWAHTMADTLDKVDSRELQLSAATFAVLLLHIAIEPHDLPSGRRAPEAVRKMLADAGLEEDEALDCQE